MAPSLTRIPKGKYRTTTVAATPTPTAGSWVLWIPRVVLFPLYVRRVRAAPPDRRVRHAGRARSLGGHRRAGVHVRTEEQQRHLSDRAVRLRPPAERRRLLRRQRLPREGQHAAPPRRDVGSASGSRRPRPIATTSTRTTRSRPGSTSSGRRTTCSSASARRPATAPSRATGSSGSRSSQSYRHALAKESFVHAYGGIHRISFVDGELLQRPDGRPAGRQRRAGAAARVRRELRDGVRRGRRRSSTRASPSPRRAAAAYFHAYGHPNFDLHESRSWIQYGGEFGAAVDLTGHQRVLKMQLALGFVDQIAGDADPVHGVPRSAAT